MSIHISVNSRRKLNILCRRAAAFSRSGDLLVTGSDDTTVLISKVHDNSLAPASVLKGHEDPVRSDACPLPRPLHHSRMETRV
eukprot:3164868-Rhodomonas_salina.3